MWKPKVLETAIVAAAFLAAIGLGIPLLTRIHDNANRRQCLENLRLIGEAIQEWSLLNDYALPPGRGMSGFVNSTDGLPRQGSLYAVEPGLNALWDKGNGVIKDINILRCPADRTLEPPPQPGEDITSPNQISYAMTGNIYPTDPPNKVIVADKSDKSLADGVRHNSANHGYRFTNVLFFDGRVRTCDQPYLPPGAGSEAGSIYIRETGLPNDTYIE
jgi:prepilin-type processing-associated H-X9-DG protein